LLEISKPQRRPAAQHNGDAFEWCIEHVRTGVFEHMGFAIKKAGRARLWRQPHRFGRGPIIRPGPGRAASRSRPIDGCPQSPKVRRTEAL
jgi:hypothetical protein